VERELQDLQDPLDQQDQLVILARLVHQVNPQHQALPDLLALLVNLDQQVLKDLKVQQVHLEVLDSLVHQELRELQDFLDCLEDKELPVLLD
jgi:hypothetical protein